MSELQKIQEKLERLTGKKVVLTEGTWALPKLPQDQPMIDAAKRELGAFKDKYWNIIGDDSLYDHIDGAIRRIDELLEHAKIQPNK